MIRSNDHDNKYINVFKSSYFGRLAVAKKDIDRETNIILCDKPISYVKSFHQQGIKQNLSKDRNSDIFYLNGVEDSDHHTSCTLCVRALLEHSENNLVRSELNLLCTNRYHDHFDESDSRYRCWLNCYASIARNAMLRKYNINVTDEECATLLSKISCNAFTVVDAYDEKLGVGLFGSLISSINHSCSPNCMQLFGNDKKSIGYHDGAFNMTVRTLWPVKQGEQLTISYTDIARPTWIRRLELIDSHGFHCSCSRCSYYSHKIDDLNGFRCRNCNNRLAFEELYESMLYRLFLTMQPHALLDYARNKFSSKLPSLEEYFLFLKHWSLPMSTILLLLNERQTTGLIKSISCTKCRHTTEVSVITKPIEHLYGLWKKMQSSKLFSEDIDKLRVLLNELTRACELIDQLLIGQSKEYAFVRIFDEYTKNFMSLLQLVDYNIDCTGIEEFVVHYVKYSELGLNLMIQMYDLYHVSIIHKVLEVMKIVTALYSPSTIGRIFHHINTLDFIRFIKHAKRNARVIYGEDHILYEELEQFEIIMRNINRSGGGDY